MEIAERQVAIGAFFRDYRQRAGVSLREAAGPVMSAAKLSRFERGEITISTDSALQLMHRMGMQMAEFVRLAEGNAYAVPDVTGSAWLGDWAAVQRTAAAYTAAHAEDSQTWLKPIMALLFEAQQTPLSSDRRLSALEERRLSAFLAYPQEWRGVEVQLIAACAPLASAEWRAECWARLAVADERPDYFRERMSVRVALLMAAAKFGEWDPYVAGLVPLTQALAQPARQIDLDQPAAVAVLREIGRWHAVGQPPQWPAIDALLAAVKTVGAPAYVPYLQRLWQCAQQPVAAHHRHGLTDAAALPAPEPVAAPATDVVKQPFSGPALAALRQRRAITLQTASIAWSPSTQLRFERGETQLGLTRMDVLKDFLLSSWRDLINSDANFHGNLVTHFRSEVARYYRAGQLTEASAHDLAAAFAAQATAVAAPVRAVQRWEVLVYGYSGLANPLPAADVQAIRQLLQTAPGWTNDLMLLFTDVALALPAAEAYRLWRGLYGLTTEAPRHPANPLNVDFNVAVCIARAGDRALAEAMARDLSQFSRWQAMQWPNAWALFAHLAALVCQWTLAPTAASEAAITAHLQAMSTLGFSVYVADAEEKIALLFKS